MTRLYRTCEQEAVINIWVIVVLYCSGDEGGFAFFPLLLHEMPRITLEIHGLTLRHHANCLYSFKIRPFLFPVLL